MYSQVYLLTWLLAAYEPTATRTTPFELDVLPHTVATAGLLGVMLVAEAAVKPSLSTQQTTYDANRLTLIDSDIIYNHSTTWQQISDIGAWFGFAAAPLASLFDSMHAGSTMLATDVATDALVLAESQAITAFLTMTLKFAVHRPRPYAYVSHGVRGIDSQMSYPSGHTSSVAALSTTYAVDFALRHPTSPWRWVVGAGSLALTGTVAYGRVAAGRHFYSDVLAGAILGGCVGFLVPYWHQRIDNNYHVSMMYAPNQHGLMLTKYW